MSPFLWVELIRKTPLYVAAIAEHPMLIMIIKLNRPPQPIPTIENDTTTVSNAQATLDTCYATVST